MKELDLMLGGFVDRHLDDLANGQFPILEDFLNEEDDRLWSWLQKAEVPVEPEYQKLISSIRSDG